MEKCKKCGGTGIYNPDPEFCIDNFCTCEEGQREREIELRRQLDDMNDTTPIECDEYDDGWGSM